MKESKTVKRRGKYVKNGHFIKKLRTERRLSLRDVGEKANMNFVYLSHLETHNREKAKLPSVDLLNKLFAVWFKIEYPLLSNC